MIEITELASKLQSSYTKMWKIMFHPGVMAEWSKAVVLSTTGAIRVGSNPTRTIVYVFASSSFSAW